MLSLVDQTRLKVSKGTDAKKKSELGQFLTPANIASFMAGLFPASGGVCRLLDAGAGIGSLSSAFLDRCVNRDLNFEQIRLKAFELDSSLHNELQRTLSHYTQQCSFSFEAIGGDFVEEAINALQFQKYDFTHAILNPPYKKIRSNSKCRLLLRQAGIETVNLYSAFVALAVALSAPGGQIVAIIPRSFCNGPYYRPFRKFVLKHTAIRHLHLFGSRDKAFKDDNVLQENIIIRLERAGQQEQVTVSTSTDDSFFDLTSRNYPSNQIVFPDDAERFIHVPATEPDCAELDPAIRYTLSDLGVTVSTGPVVDFRLKEHLRDVPEPGCVPLLYPGHFSGNGARWPVYGMKKPNAIQHNRDTEKWLYPAGFYCVVRRFSSKEEKRRIVASVVDPDIFDNAPLLGFENHLNLFHENKHGLPQALAFGLAVFLNSSVVDNYFRRFSGHTQVNATDLKLMKYPSRATLVELGNWAFQRGEVSQSMINGKIDTLSV